MDETARSVQADLHNRRQETLLAAHFARADPARFSLAALEPFSAAYSIPIDRRETAGYAPVVRHACSLRISRTACAIVLDDPQPVISARPETGHVTR